MPADDSPVASSGSMIEGIAPGGSFATGRSRFCVVLHRPGMAALLRPEDVHGPCPLRLRTGAGHIACSQVAANNQENRN
jgi:hypothetical protein